MKYLKYILSLFFITTITTNFYGQDNEDGDDGPSVSGFEDGFLGGFHEFGTADPLHDIDFSELNSGGNSNNSELEKDFSRLYGGFGPPIEDFVIFNDFEDLSPRNIGSGFGLIQEQEVLVVESHRDSEEAEDPFADIIENFDEDSDGDNDIVLRQNGENTVRVRPSDRILPPRTLLTSTQAFRLLGFRHAGFSGDASYNYTNIIVSIVANLRRGQSTTRSIDVTIPPGAPTSGDILDPDSGLVIGTWEFGVHNSTSRGNGTRSFESIIITTNQNVTTEQALTFVIPAVRSATHVPPGSSRGLEQFLIQFPTSYPVDLPEEAPVEERESEREREEDEETDDYFKDADGDGFGNPNVFIEAANQPDGYVNNDNDCDDGNPAVHQLNRCNKCKPEPDSTDWNIDDLMNLSGDDTLIGQMVDRGMEIAPDLTIERISGDGAFTRVPCKKISIGAENIEIDLISTFAFELSHIINKSISDELDRDLILGNLTRNEYLNRAIKIEAEGSILSIIVKQEESNEFNDCEKQQLTIESLNEDYSGMTLDQIKREIRENGELDSRIEILKERGFAVHTEQSLFTKYNDNYNRNQAFISSFSDFSDQMLIQMLNDTNNNNCN